jgi:hypothetical protein
MTKVMVHMPANSTDDETMKVFVSDILILSNSSSNEAQKKSVIIHHIT